MTFEPTTTKPEQSWTSLIVRHVTRALAPFAITFAVAAALLLAVGMTGLDKSALNHFAGAVVMIAALVAGVWSALRDGDPD